MKNKKTAVTEMVLQLEFQFAVEEGEMAERKSSPLSKFITQLKELNKDGQRHVPKLPLPKKLWVETELQFI